MKANAVFEGGGMRGIGIVGALAYLENQGYQWQHIAGTSVGAVIASLLASGYTSKEMMNILARMNFKDFLDKDGFHRLPLLGKAIGFLVDKGLYSGDYFEAWIDKLLKAKGISKFKDVTVNGRCRLKIVASDITRRRTLILPDDLPQYGIDPMKFSIVRAVRMSISIPFYFKPVQFLHAHGLSYIVDGALCCNFPISIFDSDKVGNIPTIGFKFDCPDISNTRIGKTDPISFLMDIINTISAEKNREWLKEENISRTILIPTGDVAPTDFNISPEKTLRLFKSGYKSASKFHATWDFNEYINKHFHTDDLTEKTTTELFN